MRVRDERASQGAESGFFKIDPAIRQPRGSRAAAVTRYENVAAAIHWRQTQRVDAAAILRTTIGGGGFLRGPARSDSIRQARGTSEPA
jgi:hypothetical protein